MAREFLCSDIDEISLHAAVRVQAHDCKRLERLCRYVTLPALVDESVQLNDAGQVELGREEGTHCHASVENRHTRSMKEQTTTLAWVERALSGSRLAVLATAGAGQPHASLVAVTPVGPPRELVFATYRNTRKYVNLSANARVAVLMHGRDTDRHGLQDTVVLTATGDAIEAEGARRDALADLHLQRHPDLAGFLGASDCAVFCVAVASYQVVRGIDDVGSWSLAQLGAS